MKTEEQTSLASHAIVFYNIAAERKYSLKLTLH